MGKKSKSKNKLAKMSEEERARYLQLRADIEEEARRRKQHLISLYMKNKLKREDAFSRLNLAKINQEWRSILRQIKCQDLKHEMIEVEKFFRIALERKDRIIHQLLSELDIAEDMYATLQQSQMETIGKLIYTHNCRMEFFKQQYDKEKSLILQECGDAFGANRDNRNKAQVQLECIVYCLQDKTQAELKRQYDDHQGRMDDVRSSMTIQLEEITKEREQKLEQLWAKYQDVLNDYIKHTESFYVEYMILKEQDEQSSTLIRDQCHEIERAADQITHLKIAAEAAEEEAHAETEYLEKTRSKLAERFAQMKTDFGERMKYEKNEFKIMGVASHMALKTLKKTLQEGESLLQLATVCRRLETEREKILPFGLPKKTLFGDPDEDSSQPPEEMLQENLLGRTSMEKFWRRVNKARMDVALMRRDKARLESENGKLKAQIKDCLVDLNINSGSNAHVNDYVARRPKSMVVERTAGFELGPDKVYGHKPMRRPYTCVEANLSNAVRSRLLVSGKPTTARITAIVRGRF